MGRRWVTKRKTSKASDDLPKFIYEVVCVLLVIAAITYAIITGSAPDNNGFS